MRDISGESWRLGLAASALSLCLGALLAWLIGSSIVTGLALANAAIKAVAEGDFRSNSIGAEKTRSANCWDTQPG